MPGSVAASSATATPNKRGGLDRQKDALAKVLEKALNTSDIVQSSEDIMYINERLEGADADLAPGIAKLLRLGSLRAAVEKVTTKNSGSLWKKMPPSMVYRRNLKEGQLYTLLNTCEPKLFKQSILEKLDRDTLIHLSTFAMNVKVGDKLPRVHEMLEHSNIFGSFCKIRYEKMGKRLAKWTPDDETSWGHFKLVDNQKVALMTGGGPLHDIKLSQLQHATDWVIHENFCCATAYLWSEEEDTNIPLFSKFAKTGATLPEAEGVQWNIPMDEWPKEMRPKVQQTEGEAVAPPKKRPRGSGGAAATPKKGRRTT